MTSHSSLRPSQPQQGKPYRSLPPELAQRAPELIPSSRFPSSPLAVVNSPVVVTVNGKPAEVLAAVGFPNAVNGYQVNFRLPPDTSKGTVTVQVSAAWIVGPAVSITVQ